jgi:hypothetical protein
MHFISEKFKNYHSFASSKLIDILPKDKMYNAVVYEISNFESIILINNKGIIKTTVFGYRSAIESYKRCFV